LVCKLKTGIGIQCTSKKQKQFTMYYSLTIKLSYISKWSMKKNNGQIQKFYCIVGKLFMCTISGQQFLAVKGGNE
jgi:hypothetical protein